MIFGIVFSALIGSFILIVLVPPQYFTSVVCLLLIPVALAVIVLFIGNNFGPLGFLYFIPLAYLLAAVLPSIAVKLLLFAYRAAFARGGNTAGVVPPSSRAVAFFSDLTRLQLACWGGVAAVVAMLGLRFLLGGMSPPWLAHLIAIAAIAGLWLIPRRVDRPEADPQLITTDRRLDWWLSGFRWSLAVLLALAMAMPILVVIRARDIAGTARYCIQVAARDAYYRPAESLLDLSGLTMRGRVQRAGQNHAQLVVQRDGKTYFYNWSYGRLKFMNDAWTRWSGAVCSPQVRFAKQMPPLFSW